MEPHLSPAGLPCDPDSHEAAGQQERERGQGMVEYAFILALVVIVLLLSVQVIGHQTSGMYSNISNGFTGH